MVLGLLLREEEEQSLVFDFEYLLPDDSLDGPQEDQRYSAESNPFLQNQENARKKDFKRGTVVCRHWLRALCMKGDNCEFLHQYDMSKMPECRWGMECQVPECPFRHVPDEERVECAFYKQGFCSHGSSCRYRHVKLAREECPEKADFSLQSKVADEENCKRRKAQPVNEFFKIARCKHWDKTGECPFKEDCHFAHGDEELRPFPRGEKEPGPSNNIARPTRPFPSNTAFPTANTSGPAGPQLPNLGKSCAYILIQSYSYLNLAAGVHHNIWSLSPQMYAQVRECCLQNTIDEVFCIFTVTSSKHYQGIAKIINKENLLPVQMDTQIQTDQDLLATQIVPYPESPEITHELSSVWTINTIPLEWLHVCECPHARLMQFEQKNLPVLELPSCHLLENDMGEALMRLIFNQPQIKLHQKSVDDEQKLPGKAEALAIRRREAAEAVADMRRLNEHTSAIGDNTNGMQAGPPSRWKISHPGFVFACNNSTIDESFGRFLFGLAQEQEASVLANVQIGTPLFLLNMSDRHLLGIFEAAELPRLNIIPDAFVRGPHAPSPFPVQVHFAVSLNAPAIPTSDPQIAAVAGDRGIRIGPLSLEVTQALANIFAERCGATNQPHMPTPNQQPIAHIGSENGPASSMSETLLEKMVVGIEPDNDFGVTRRIIGPAGSHMKHIEAEAGGNTKIRVRGRGSGTKDFTNPMTGIKEESNEPLMILVTSETNISLRRACDMVSDLLGNIHREFQMYLQHTRGGFRPNGPPGPPPFGHQMQMRGPPPFMQRGGPGQPSQQTT